MDRSRFLYGPAMRYFACTAEEGSIRAAARRLNVASSAVNRQILTLEDQLGVQLFERVGRTIRLSTAGEIVLAHIKRTLSDFQSTFEELEALKGVRRGTVSIASVESVSQTLLPEVISAFRKSFSGIHVSLHITSSKGVIEAVENAEADVGFTFDPPSSGSVDVAFQRSLKIGAIMSPQHPLAEVSPLTLAQCFLYPVALPSKGLSLRTQLDAILEKTMPRSKTCIEANSLSFMRLLTRDDQTVSFQTMIGLEEEIAAGRILFKELDEPQLSEDRLSVITSAMRGLPLAPAMFFDHAVANLKKMLPAISLPTDLRET
ncbi:LysR family transcriptional regulator [Pseudovibrio sp. SPO723]|uniref:LysR family transcriptional regulator n=1 Tax=Nesiotobacter zosterae TaxID=392721 RepID=UPI0029C3F99A|nr:LysR family transcriptional regulator [Pseudovibrio sp. SPO723]MDX5593887.1 LysR family transcriptional regulator [Pseudovibrio sp. SPO723]